MPRIIKTSCPIRLSIAAMLRPPSKLLGLVNVGYSLTGVSERYYMAQNIPVNKIDGYVEHTATLWREFTMKGCHLRLQAEVINLTDKQYDVIKYYPMPGRSWRITGVLRF